MASNGWFRCPVHGRFSLQDVEPTLSVEAMVQAMATTQQADCPQCGRSCPACACSTPEQLKTNQTEPSAPPCLRDPSQRMIAELQARYSSFMCPDCRLGEKCPSCPQDFSWMRF